MSSLINFIYGSILGVVAGLFPGIHPNLISSVFHGDAYFLIPLAVTNSIVNTIPAILFGAPSIGTELSVLPGHRLLLKGRGFDAIRRTIIGSMLAGVYSVALMPFFLILSRIYYKFQIIIPIALIIVAVSNIMSDNSPQFAAFSLVFSGLIGILSHGMLLPALTGMFGLSRIILSNAAIPEQSESVEFISSNVERKSSFVGSALGMITGIVPGMGSSQAAFIASKFSGDFLTALGAITTSNVIFSILAAFTIHKIRTGVAQNIFIETPREAVSVVGLAMFSIALGGLAALHLSKLLVRNIHKVNYKLVNLLVGLFIIAITYVMCGTFGLLVLFTSTSLGVMAIKKRVKQSNLLGVVIIPTLVFFISKFI